MQTNGIIKNINDLYSVLDHIPVGVCIINKHFQILFWNRCLEDWTQVSKLQAEGMALMELFPHFNSQQYKSRLDSIFAGGAPIIFSSQLHKHIFTAALPNGALRIQHTTVTAVPDPYNENEYNAMFSVEDVTELTKRIQDYRKMRDKILEEIENRQAIEKKLIKAKEKAETSDKLKSRFLANMSHEVRTPLNSILGFSELLLNKNHNGEKGNQFMKIINDSGKQLLSIINDIIDISKLESGEMKFRYTLCSINDLLEELFTYYQSDLAAKGKQNIELKLSNGLNNKEGQMYTDDIRLRQVLNNLLSNAVKFTDEGYIEFGYRKMETLDSDPVLRFYVQDTGIGMAKEKHHYIFQLFRQGEESLNRKYGGSGLGLAICKGIIEQFHGKIWVASEENKGATFYFTLPYKPISEHEDEQQEYEWSDKTILVVEDLSVIYYFIKEVLLPTNASLLHAKTGEEAIAICKENPSIDLILMDIQLPGINGYEATKTIKNINPQIIVIAQTANALAEDRKKSVDAGCDDYMAKPLRVNTLLTLLGKYLQNNAGEKKP